MLTAATSSPAFIERPQGGWWFHRWGSAHVEAGITDRATTRAALLPHGRPITTCIEGEQVHGASVAVIERIQEPAGLIAGCDALVTRLPGLALVIRTADCLPMFFCDPARDVVGIAHVGWRGLAASLPIRVISALRHVYHVRIEDLHVAIGPAIRACCYEVGPELSAHFGPFVRQQQGRRPFDAAQGGVPSGVEGRRTCDLIGAAIDQLTRCGIAPERIVDSGQCTSCKTDRWFSLRREGPSTGRLTSLIMLRPS